MKVIIDARGHYFHFWDKNQYGEPQFGDLYHAKRYSARGVHNRLRALINDGYVVVAVPVEKATAPHFLF